MLIMHDVNLEEYCVEHRQRIKSTPTNMSLSRINSNVIVAIG